MKLNEYIKTNECHFLVLFFLGLLIVLLTSFQVQIGWISLNFEFGLLQLLPLSFWIGFVIMLISCLVCVNSDSEKAFFLKAFLIFFVAWNLPVLFETTTSNWDSFFHLSTAIMTNDSAYLKNVMGGNYLSWPGFFVFGNGFYNLLGLEAFDFTKYYRYFSVSLVFLAFFVFLKKMLSKNHRIGLVILTFLPVWMSQFHFSPQSIGFPFFLLLLSILFFKRPAFWLVGLIMAVWLLVSHPTTMAFVFPIFVAWSLLSLFYWFIIIERNPIKFLSQPLSAVLIIFILLGAVFFLNSYVSKLVTILPIQDDNSSVQAAQITKQQTILDIVLNRISAESNPTANVFGKTAIYFKKSIDEKIGVNSSLLIVPDSNKDYLELQAKPVLPEYENSIIERSNQDLNFAKTISITPVLSLGPNIRAFFFFSLSFLSLLFFFSWPRLKEKSEKNIYLFLFGGFLSLVLLVQIGPTVLPALTGFIDRVILYSSIFLALMVLFISKYYPRFETTIVSILFLLALINFSTAYFNESLNVIGTQNKTSLFFIEDNASDDAKIWANQFPFIQTKNIEFRGSAFSNAWGYAFLQKNWENWAVFSDYDLIWERRWGGGFLEQKQSNLKYSLTTSKLFETDRIQIFEFGRMLNQNNN